MADELPDALTFSPLPDFGEGIAHREHACSARELFCRLFVDLEEHVHFLEPAFRFAVAATRDVALPALPGAALSDLDALVAWARADFVPPALRDAELARRVAIEFAPTGLCDGAWLRGSVLANAVETEVSMLSLKQLMLRFGDPGSHQAYSERYAALLRSLGVPPASITRDTGEPAEDADCAPIAYEHALLGLCLGLFPTALGAEALGFNLWMATVGPCPLLVALQDELRSWGGSLQYLERHDRETMAQLARQSVQQALAEVPDVAFAERIARGFVAAHRSYERWERAVLGERVPLAGLYTPPQDPEALEEFAFERYGELSFSDLYYCFANSDCHPAIHVFGRVFVSEMFDKLSMAFDADERLNSTDPPRYSERAVAEMVAAQHEKNVRSRDGYERPSPETAEADDGLDTPSIIQVFDGSWLQGFADVQRADYEEYGWLFRIYASEHGDGDWAYNHCQIFRKAFTQLGPNAMLPKTDRRLYDLFDIGAAAVATLAVSLNTRAFMPEILGINLGIEATGVGGSYMDQWKNARGTGAEWRALAWRLHNSIDNYADGHTKWSLSAVQAFMRRVKDATPADVDAHWRRIWHMWRCQDILTHGTESERAALSEHVSFTSLAPTPA